MNHSAMWLLEGDPLTVYWRLAALGIWVVGSIVALTIFFVGA
jgi:anti-sigma factor RsiW